MTGVQTCALPIYCYGECAFLSGDKEEAAKVFRRALEQQPNSSRALCNLGSVYRVSGRHSDAIACFEKAMESDPDFQPTYINFAVALYETSRPREALALLERALNKWPQLQMATDVHRRISAEITAPRQ